MERRGSGLGPRSGVRGLIKVYDAVIIGLAILAGVVVAAVFASIVYDVSLRTLGWQPPYWTSALVEYALMTVTMLASPWVVRIKGHVFVELLAMVIPDAMLRVLATVVYLACIGICLVLAWYSGAMALEFYVRGEIDIRAIALPRWYLFGLLSGGMVLCATEFLRFLLGADTMYAARGKRAEGL